MDEPKPGLLYAVRQAQLRFGFYQRNHRTETFGDRV